MKLVKCFNQLSCETVGMFSCKVSGIVFKIFQKFGDVQIFSVDV